MGLSYTPDIPDIIDMENLLIMIVYLTSETQTERKVCLKLIESGSRLYNLSYYLKT